MACDTEHLTLDSFCISIEENAAEANEMICSGLVEYALTHKMCKKWFQIFSNGGFDLFDRERSGQPKKFEENLEKRMEKIPTQTEEQLTHALVILPNGKIIETT